MDECKHENFSVEADVQGITPKDGEPAYRWQADIRIRCITCGLPFRFIGLPAGVDLNGACTSVNAEEGRFAIAPRGHILSVIEGAPVGFSVKRSG
jgi:hypothetical protein